MNLQVKIYERIKKTYTFLNNTIKSIKTLFAFKKTGSHHSYFLFKILDKINNLTLMKL